MRWLLFLSRLAFICGVFFLLAISLTVRGIENWAKDDTLTSNIIIIGVLMGEIVVPVTNLCYLVIKLARKRSGVPAWLTVANILFLFVMFFYIFNLK